jgi:threonine dehydrogenase-like Zn-dependent dehydrogenase
MRALCLTPGGLELREDYPKPEVRPGEVMLRVLKAGICTTDLELVKGYAGFQGVLGHEFVGLVEEGSPSEWLGRRVVGTINLGCGGCPECLGSGPEHCPQRTVLGIAGKDGAFAEFVTLPATNLLPVPEALSDDEAVFVEPLAAALRIREQISVRPSERAVVVGPGRLGLLVAQVLAQAGTRTLVLGRRQDSLDLPHQLGLEVGLVADAPGDRFDLVVEATGNQEGLAEALRLVRPRGVLVMKSTFHGAAAVDLTKVVVGEIRVVGSRCGPFEPALELLDQRAVKVKPLIDGEYPLSEGIAGMEHAAASGVRKILLQP